MSFIDELCSYLLKKGLVPLERCEELQRTLNPSEADLEVLEAMSHPENVPWGHAPWEIPPYDETKFPDIKAWVATWKLKEEPQEHTHERGGGPRRNSANRKAIKAPELNDLLPDIILKDKLLARLFPTLATGKWNPSSTWKEWCDAIEFLYTLDSTALDAKLQKLLASPIPRLKACLFDFIDFYERTGLLQADALKGYSGQAVSPFKTLLANEQNTDFTFNKYNWLFINKNLLVAYHASLVNNRLRPLFKVYWKTICNPTNEKAFPDVSDLIANDEELCRIFVRTFPWKADALWHEWVNNRFDQAFPFVKEACIFFEEAALDLTLRIRGFFREETLESEPLEGTLFNGFYSKVLNPNLENKVRKNILYVILGSSEYIPRLLACGADPKHKAKYHDSPIEMYLSILNDCEKPFFPSGIIEPTRSRTELIQDLHELEAWSAIEQAGDVINTLFSLQATPDDMADKHAEGWQLIHWAAFKSSLNLLYYIFGHTTTPPQTITPFLTNNNETPFHCAYFGKKEEYIELFYLLRCICGKEIFKKLITVQDRWGYTALHNICFSSYKDDSELIPLLIQDGAQVNNQTRWLNTPLHTTLDTLSECKVGKYKYDAKVIVKKILFLLKGGASLDIKNRDGQTPLDIAAKEIGPEAVELLLHPDDENARLQVLNSVKA